MTKFPLPPLIRFLNELGYWAWMLLLGWWIPLILSLLSLSLINFPGDKKPADVNMAGIYVAGPIRTLVEVVWGLVGIYAAYNMGTIYLIVQFILVVGSLVLDWERHLWMFGRRDEAPWYVTSIHK